MNDFNHLQDRLPLYLSRKLEWHSGPKLARMFGSFTTSDVFNTLESLANQGIIARRDNGAGIQFGHITLG